MNRSALTTVVAVVASFAVGLGWSWYVKQGPGGVAVVDLDEVARRLGRDNEMSQAVQVEAGRLTQTLQQQQQLFNSKLEEVRLGLPDEPTTEQAREFLKTRQTAQLKLNQLKQLAENQLGQHRQQLISKFRQDAKPIAARVASQKGFATVVTRNDSVVFSFDNAVDITDDVIALMSAEMPERPAQRTPATQSAQPTVEQAAAPAATESVAK